MRAQIRIEQNQIIKKIRKSTKMNQSKYSCSLTNSISYSDDIYSEDYVAQFLDFTSFHQINCYSEDLQKSSIFDKKEESLTITTIKGPVEESQEGEKFKSSFHNFQKHLVTTLRHSIDLSCVQFDQDTKGMELILWNFFLKCPKMTRTLIYLVFGGLSMDSAKAKRFNKQYGLQKIIKSYSSSLIKKAQKNLRQQTLKQASRLNFSWQLGNRRMKNKEQFRVYFEAFIEELKDGGFNKRIPKQKKLKAQKQLSKTKQDFQGLSFNKA